MSRETVFRMRAGVTFVVGLWSLLAAIQAAVGAAWLVGDATAPAFFSPTRATDVALGAFLLATFPFQVALAVGLAAGRRWARGGAFAAAVPGMLVYPVGTILCSMAVLVLLQPEMAEAFSPSAARDGRS